MFYIDMIQNIVILLLEVVGVEIICNTLLYGQKVRSNCVLETQKTLCSSAHSIHEKINEVRPVAKLIPVQLTKLPAELCAYSND